MWRCGAVLTALLVLAPIDARAEPLVPKDTVERAEPRAPWSVRATEALRSPSFALNANVGFGTPLGLLGMLAEVTPVGWLAIGAGAGYGRGGVQGALSSRFRILLGPVAVSPGFSASVGRYESSDAGSVCLLCSREAFGRYEWDPAFWLNGDVSLETRLPSGLQGRAYVGYGAIVNRNDYECVAEFTDLCNDEPATSHLPYVGVALGYAWRL